MDFSDSRHSPVGLTLHSAEEIEPERACKQEVIDALAAWRDRSDHVAKGLELLRLDGCPHFSISYDGKAEDYWPDEAQNDISETLVRGFLFHDGICKLTDDRVHLFHVRYSMLAMSDADCLLVCPYLTEAGNISGIDVVLVTNKIREPFLTH
jgi:hypothetical protein